jgi:hypothetical protein
MLHDVLLRGAFIIAAKELQRLVAFEEAHFEGATKGASGDHDLIACCKLFDGLANVLDRAPSAAIVFVVAIGHGDIPGFTRLQLGCSLRFARRLRRLDYSWFNNLCTLLCLFLYLVYIDLRIDMKGHECKNEHQSCSDEQPFAFHTMWVLMMNVERPDGKRGG